MQIDTRNRDCRITPETDILNSKKCPITGKRKFYPGLEPKQARYGIRTKEIEESNITGLSECPCTSRYGGDF